MENGSDVQADRADFLTSDQVIERLLSQPALRSRAATCVLPAIRVGSEWRFRRTDLDRWISRELNRLAAPGGQAS
jgi:excisionase family DNA binding protein